MTLNIVLLAKDRPRLTFQCLTTLVRYTDVEWNAVIVDDGSKHQTRDMLSLFGVRDNVAVLRNETSKGITGQARNLGVYWAEKYWGRGDYLYLSDNDVCFLPGWASKMAKVYDGALEEDFGISVLGGARHPYHQPIATHCGWQETEAVAGYSQLMHWEDWDEYGPLDAHAPGTCQSEDHQFCQKARADGLPVGYMTEAVLIDCGLTGTDGKPAIGAEAKPRLEGYYYE